MDGLILRSLCHILQKHAITHQKKTFGYFWGIAGGLPGNTKMAHPGTSCPRKMKTAAKNTSFYIGSSIAWTTFGGLGFSSSFHCGKMSRRTSKPTVSHSKQHGVKRFWAAWFANCLATFYNTNSCSSPTKQQEIDRCSVFGGLRF